MAKIKLLIVTICTLAFLLSLWAIPAVIVWIAFAAIDSLWLKVAAIVVAAIWLLLIRPWTMFTGKRFSNFLDDLALALRHIFFLD